MSSKYYGHQQFCVAKLRDVVYFYRYSKREWWNALLLCSFLVFQWLRQLLFLISFLPSKQRGRAAVGALEFSVTWRSRVQSSLSSLNDNRICSQVHLLGDARKEPTGLSTRPVGILNLVDHTKNYSFTSNCVTFIKSVFSYNLVKG